MRKPLEDVEASQHVTAPAKAESVPILTDFVSTYAGEMMFDDKRIGEVKAALEEALDNIIRFACPTGSEEITITCSAHEMGAMLLDIVDTGVPFNMLVMSTFPETTDFAPAEQVPSTRKIKKYIKNIEYRRDGEAKKNILVLVVWK
jgi:anti-sigma regulatory factor (Ser/Thr protein kinase)